MAQVFISAKSADFTYAERVYHRLAEAGVSAFFSQETLPELKNADYRREIDRALDEVDHMIVVTSSLEHVLAPWVEAEWGFFINEQRSGRKRGNLVTVVVGDLAPGDLPPALRYNQVIPFEGDGLDRVLAYVTRSDPRPLTRSVAPARGRRPVFRESSTFGGSANAHVIAASPTEPVVATGGYDGAVRVYDVRSGTRLAVLGSSQYWRARHSCLVTTVEFSPDGHRVAAGQIDGTVHLWDLESEEELDGALRHSDAVSGLVFGHDGRTIATSSKDGGVNVWHLDSPSHNATHHTPTPIVAAAGLRGRAWRLTGVIDRMQRRHRIDVQGDSVVADNLASIAVDPFARFAVSDEGRLLATGTQDGIVRIYDFNSVAHDIEHGTQPTAARQLIEWRAHRRTLSALSFFSDPSRLVTCAMEDHVSIWDTQTGKISLRIQGTTDERFASATALEGGRLLAAALFDGRVRVWEEE
jgi:hypothetical protein